MKIPKHVKDLAKRYGHKIDTASISGRGHVRVTFQNGARVSMSNTPSDKAHCVKNALADLRRYNGGN